MRELRPKCRSSLPCVSEFLASLISAYCGSEKTALVQASAAGGNLARRLGAPLDLLAGSNAPSASSGRVLRPQKTRPNAAAHRSRLVIQVLVAQRACATSTMS